MNLVVKVQNNERETSNPVNQSFVSRSDYRVNRAIELGEDFRDDARTDSTTTFANCKAHTIFDRNGAD